MADNSIYERKLNTPGPKELVFRYIPYLPLVVLCLTVAWFLAWLKLRYTTPIYDVYGKILVKDENPYSNSSEKFSAIFDMPRDNTNLNNEIEIIKSRSMAARVIRSLGLQKQYSIRGNIRTSEASADDVPFNWIIESLPDSSQLFSFEVTVVSNSEFRLNEEQTLYNFGQQIKKDKIDFRLIPNRSSGLVEPDKIYTISWVPVDRLAAGFSNNIKIVQQEGASVLNLSLNTSNKKNGVLLVNGYMKEYQLSSLEDKKLIAKNTLVFIDDQLDTLKNELGGVEKNLQIFREKNNVFNTEAQATSTFGLLTESQQRITEQGVKIKVVDYLIRYIADPENVDKLVPSNLGIEEPSLVLQVNGFNEIQLKRETALKTTTKENPIVKNMDAKLAKIRQDILQNLRNIRGAYNVANSELQNSNFRVNENLKSLPGKEKQLLEVTRRQAILQELYSFLLQKKLETAISSASTVSDITILEPAVAGSSPVQPNRSGFYTIALFVGLAVPGLIIFLRQAFNDKLSSRLDIEEITEAPILGEVGHADDPGALVVKENNRSYIAEQFRIIRSNLQYVLPKNEKPIILVTSTFSGEGKSFISTNLGSVMALSGKKTVILEMDIRKPKILRGLGMNERKGITNYVVSNIDLSEIIHKVPEVTDMYVIPCGPVPPNPGELLLDEKIGDLFVELKKRFDAIIIDSAPVGLVSDGITLAEYSNTTVYIVRHNYTLKKQIQMIDEIFESKKLPHLSLVINDIQISGGYGGYYGYGYGYGFGKKEGASQYFHGKERKVGLWEKCLKLLKFKTK